MAQHEIPQPGDHDDVVRSDAGRGEPFSDIVARRLSRRDVLRAGAVLGAGLAAGGALGQVDTTGAHQGLDFTPVPAGRPDDIHVPPGYHVQSLLRWGDPLTPDAPPFDPANQTPEAQAKQFGYNCDFVGYFPLAGSNDRGLLCVNHEYVDPVLMFSGYARERITPHQVRVCMEAVGHSVVEIRREAHGPWSLIKDSPLNRRVSATTECLVSGPAAGHAWMQTKADPAGLKVIGTHSNCAAGRTPWGTVLTTEENFQDHFGSLRPGAGAVPTKLSRYGVGDGPSVYGWETVEARWDIHEEPNEPNRFGWVVEIDPLDPSFQPVKRTALGRFRHEAATTHVTASGHVVMYSGDDARFEYVYKFVSAKRFNKRNREANRDLMDDGTLYVARFDADGTGTWVPMVQGQGPLTAENGFADQGAVLIHARQAADLLGATKMDRPEDIEVNPANQRVYVVCTNNIERGREGKAGTDSANPRKENRHGHIVEILEEGDDHTATRFRWELFLVCGDPNDPGTYYQGLPASEVSGLSCPDDITFDQYGNLWIATDGQESSMGLHDGVFATPVDGPDRGKVRQFMASVPGSEVCGPEFTPDNTTFFAAIQHPGEQDGSTYDTPSTRWPDGEGPPRPTVIAITCQDGSPIGAPKEPLAQAWMGWLGRTLLGLR